MPLNERGRLAVTGDEYAEFIDSDFASMRYSDEDSMVLTRLFMDFNTAFNLMIDDCEDEILPTEKLPATIEMTKGFLENAEEVSKARITRFLMMLELAQRTM